LSIAESIAVILGVVFLVVQIRQQTKIARADHIRRRKQSTIEFHNLIYSENNAFLDFINNQPLDPKAVEYDKDLEQNVLKCLFTLESLAVGVAAEVYDFDILSHIVSRSLYLVYTKLELYIQVARKKGDSPTRYMTFEKMAKKLKSHRDKHPYKAIDKIDL
jgi:hypothetical protein